jgi:hypothetical protein
VSCHDNRWDFFDHAVTGVTLDETHSEADCTDCHEGGVGTAASCEACHDDDRTYGPDTAFRASSP